MDVGMTLKETISRLEMLKREKEILVESMSMASYDHMKNIKALQMAIDVLKKEVK